MKTSPVTEADLRASILSVPPLSRKADFTIDRDQNARLLAHLRSGGVSTFMYGGNANLYNMSVSEFGVLLELLETLAVDGDWMIPSVGSDFGKALDQVAIAKRFSFPTVMALPHRFPATPTGVATGLRRLADAYGKPLIAYVKDDGYIDAKDLSRLAADGVICAVKYAIVRDNPAVDPFLTEMLNGVDRKMVISGIGERPAIEHLTTFALTSFTSGSVCVAPRLSTQMKAAIERGDLAEAQRLRALFLPLEDLRDKHSPLRVLHAAVGLAGVSETGPLLPYLADITDPAVLSSIKREAIRLLDANKDAKAKAA